MKTKILRMPDEAGGGDGAEDPNIKAIGELDKRITAGEKKIVIIVGSAKEAESVIKALTNRVNDLETHILDLQEARPLEAKIEPAAEPRTIADVMKAELKAIETDPEPFIARKIEYGMKREDAEVTINRRKAHLQRELGIKVPAIVKKAAKAAAMIALLFGLFASAVMPVRADQQGYPSTYGSPTNWNLMITNATAAPVIYIKLRQTPQMALGYQLAFECSWTNLSGSVISWFYPSVDGTNIFTGQAPGILSGTLNSTNPVIVATNFTAVQLRGFSGLFVVTSNNCSGTIPTNVIVQGSFTNSFSTNIPAGPLWNQPNQ